MAWLTTEDGRRVNTDWFDKDRQIAKNNVEADRLNGRSVDLSSLSYVDTKEWFTNNSNYSKWNDKIEEEEWEETIYKYTGEVSDLMNNYLRTGNFSGHKYYDEQDIKQYVKELDNIIKEFELKSPLTTYRVSDSNLLGKHGMSYEQIKSMEGKIVSDKGYMSTSTIKSIPGEQTVHGDIRYIINVPSGKGKGAYISKYSENSQEREMLLKRGAQYVVTKVQKDTNGRTVVYLNMW